MTKDTMKKIEEYLLNHKKMTLATVSPEGKAIAHTVQYASKGNTVYFFTKPTQRKVNNIKANASVGYTVDQDYNDWSKIQGVQMQGSARVLEDRADVNGAFMLFADKFPHMAAMGTAFLEHHVIVEVKPVLGRFLDNTAGFGYFDEVDY